tara:strand:+ start:3505 stop:6621 length:3117 start_codon:yes stop_codon:yes gene_type:complete
MNILGRPFSPWVTEQINARQASLGNSTNLTNSNLLYQNAKAPWIRLASTVDIKAIEGKNTNFSKLANFGLSDTLIQGDTAARNFILQGGTTKLVDGTGEPNSGLNISNSLYNGAYGWGGIEERGFVPMPGIISASVQYYNNGALSKSTINMKCYSRNQLALMDVLYMRPGYNLLLEFGWSQYLNNSGELVQTDNFFSDPLSFIFNPTSVSSESPTHFDVLNLIQNERIASNGNYEGVFGKITNFNWTFNPDGSYDCKVDLTGMGDMMESLKVNIKLPSKKDNDEGKSSTTPDTASETEIPPIIANKDKTTLNKVLFDLYEKNTSVAVDTYQALNIKSFPNVKTEIDSNGKIITEYKEEDITIKNGMLALIGTTTDIEQNSSPQVYITFGALIAYIQKYLLIYNKEGSPMFAFDVNFKEIEKDENYIVHIPGQFSSNPLSCLIPYQGLPEGVADDVNLVNTNVNETLLLNKSSFLTDNEYLGRLTGIYLNINNLATILDKSKRSEDGSLSLLTYLNSIITSFTQALGGINMISIKVDEVTQSIKFIENSPQRFTKEESNETYARFNTFGVKPDTEGSFIRNIVMGGELGPKYASMITIGAQFSGNKLSSNATGFSTYNLGLEDRVIPQKLNHDFDAGTEADSIKEVELTIGDIWNKQINQKDGETSKSLFESIYNSRLFISEDINALQELNYNFINQISGKLVEIKQLQSPIFLPFNLSVDMDGLAGIRLFERFLLDDSILPPSYGEGNVDLLVKSLNHQVDAMQWVTSMDTQAVSSQKLDPVAKPSKLLSTTTRQSNASGGGGNPVGELGSESSLTSGYPMAKIYYDGPTSKSQIVVHHTAGRQNIANTIKGWSSRTDHVSTHYITNNDGEKEQLYSDDAWGNHLGIKSATFRALGVEYQNLNKTSLGIEMQAFGGLKERNGKYYTYVNSEMPSDRVAQPVDKNGNVTSYKGYSYYEKYSNANISAVKSIITGWMGKYGIPFVYDYDVLFPNTSTVSKAAYQGTKGVYTHNSFRTGKSDVFPQKELIAMFKSIATQIV